MIYERIVGLDIVDEQAYQKYREAMLPILHRYGGVFAYDFKIAEVLLSKTPEVINRVFSIYFSSKEIMEAFFSSPQYMVVQQQYFNKAVRSKTLISVHKKDT